MKKHAKILLTSACLLALTFTMVAGPKPAANATNRFAITGMKCGGCAAGLQFELEEAKGVVSANVVFSNRLAVVVYDTNVIRTAGLTNVIKQAGFKSRLLPLAKRR